MTSYVQGVYSTLFRSGEIVPVAYIGGVFRSTFMRRALSNRVREAIACELTAPRFDPAAGAVLEALKLDGNPSSLITAA